MIDSMTPSDIKRGGYQRARSLVRHLEAVGMSEETSRAARELVTELEGLLGVKMSEQPRSDSDLLKQELAGLKFNLGDEYDTLETEAKMALSKFGHVYFKVRKIQAKLQEELNKRMSKIDSAHDGQAIHASRTSLDRSESLLEELAEKNPISLKAYRLLWIREQKRNYATTGIIETPQLRQHNDALLTEALRMASANNNVVTLMGPTGTGKTALAKKIAYELAQFHTIKSKESDDKEPLYYFVSAHSRMTPEDLLERDALTVQDSPLPSEVAQEISREIFQYRENSPELSPEQLSSGEEIIRDLILRRSSSSVMITKKVLAEVGKAADKGKPVIIDEFNYLPPETLAALNDLLSGEHEPGFKVIFTGNPVSQGYIGRKGLDSALINRILSGLIPYDFPPQELQKSFSASIFDPMAEVDSEATNQDKVPDRDLFQIACLQLVDENGNLYAPDNVFEQVWDLARAFAMAQRLASKKDSHLNDVVPAGDSQDNHAFQFDSVFLSFRNLNTVIEAWKNDGYTKPLGWYVTKIILSPASVVASEDAAQLAYLFFEAVPSLRHDLEMGQLNINHERWSMSGLEKVTVTNDFLPSSRYYTTDEVVESLFGKKLPSYETLGTTQDTADEADEARREAEASELFDKYTELKKRFDGFLNVEEVCGQLGHV